MYGCWFAWHDLDPDTDVYQEVAAPSPPWHLALLAVPTVVAILAAWRWRRSRRDRNS